MEITSETKIADLPLFVASSLDLFVAKNCESVGDYLLEYECLTGEYASTSCLYDFLSKAAKTEYR